MKSSLFTHIHRFPLNFKPPTPKLMWIFAFSSTDFITSFEMFNWIAMRHIQHTKRFVLIVCCSHTWDRLITIHRRASELSVSNTFTFTHSHTSIHAPCACVCLCVKFFVSFRWEFLWNSNVNTIFAVCMGFVFTNFSVFPLSQWICRKNCYAEFLNNHSSSNANKRNMYTNCDDRSTKANIKTISNASNFRNVKVQLFDAEIVELNGKKIMLNLCVLSRIGVYIHTYVCGFEQRCKPFCEIFEKTNCVHSCSQSTSEMNL